MLTTDTTSAKERVCGHYEVTQTPWATDPFLRSPP